MALTSFALSGERGISHLQVCYTPRLLSKSPSAGWTEEDDVHVDDEDDDQRGQVPDV